jgi:hypothetical protein
MGRLAELQRNLLTQLMGAEAMGIITTDVSMWDPKVCRPFVTGICPHDLFTNTVRYPLPLFYPFLNNVTRQTTYTFLKMWNRKWI